MRANKHSGGRGRQSDRQNEKSQIAGSGTREAGAILLLVAFTVAAYWAVGAYPFILYDDELYVYENMRVRQGLTLEGIRWALTSLEVSNWHPMTWLSHMLDVELFGADTAGAHHLTSLCWHVVNSVLTFVIFSRLTGAFGPSLFVAAVFALHPLHVESVAWVSERKDVLSQFFWLLMIGSYARYAQKLEMRWYVATAVCLGFGLMSKPMLVTAPFVLLLLDYWPLHRVAIGANSKQPDEKAQRANRKGSRAAKKSARVSTPIGVPMRSPGALLLEKTPLFLMIVASSAAAYQAQLASGSVVPYSLSHRLATAITAYVRYIGKTLWPTDLAVLYPSTPGMWSGTQVGGALAVLGSISLVVLLLRRHRYLTVGWLFYLGTLVPVAGFVSLGGHSMADRYMYMPLIGLTIMLAWGIASLGQTRRPIRVASTVLACLALGICFALTVRQVEHWSNSVRLYEHAVEVTEGNYIMHNNLGSAYQLQGEPDKAIAHYIAAIGIRPSYIFPYVNLGTTYRDRGRLDEAVVVYREAVRVNPSYPKAHRLLGSALLRQQNLPEAIESLRRALEMQPGVTMTYHDLALALAMQGDTEEAAQLFRAGLERAPDDAWLNTSYGNLLRLEGRFSEAITHHRTALRQAPGAGPHNTLGMSLMGNRQTAEAIAEFQAALRIDPNHREARQALQAAENGLMLERQMESK